MARSIHRKHGFMEKRYKHGPFDLSRVKKFLFLNNSNNSHKKASWVSPFNLLMGLCLGHYAGNSTHAELHIS